MSNSFLPVAYKNSKATAIYDSKKHEAMYAFDRWVICFVT